LRFAFTSYFQADAISFSPASGTFASLLPHEVKPTAKNNKATNKDTELNLRAISRFLITNPEARIRFQYPTIPKSQHPNVQSDMKSIYDMSFSQITNHLRTQGVENLNQRVLRSSGSDFNVFLDD
jgi:hypothetical protein